MSGRQVLGLRERRTAAAPTGRRTALSATRSHQPWPRGRARRWALRLAFALPPVGLARYAWTQGYANPAHARIVDQAAQVTAGWSDLSGRRPPTA
nr:hypothetical protein [Streptomyces sp. 846.5]